MIHHQYIVITPARNEERHLPGLIESMVQQTHRALKWVIVDDGSADRTGEIARAAASVHPWIVSVQRTNRGYRKQGGGVVDAFYDGYAHAAREPWDYVVKLDADLTFGPDYFQSCFQKFAADPTLGIGGGVFSNEVSGQLICESPADPLFHVRGATKIYRRACWEAIGELHRAPGWDTIDELKANMLGWTTRTFRDVPICHHRLTGTEDGTWKNYVKFGIANYVSGYHPLFVLAKCLKRVTQSPHVIGPVGLFYGYCSARLRRFDRVNDEQLVRFVRREQLRALVGRSALWN